MNIIINDQDTFRKYRLPAKIKYASDMKTPISCQNESAYLRMATSSWF